MATVARWVHCRTPSTPRRSGPASPAWSASTARRDGVRAAYGLADRAHGVPNTVDTLFATASGTKGLTALAVMSLVERGTLELGTTARSLLGEDLPLIADDVTVEHLLAHRSGIGDYLDEDAVDDITDYVMPVPVHELATTEQFLAVLDGHETVFPAGERFAYNNGGYVVLALLAERASGVRLTTSWFARWSASPPAWSTPRSCAPTSSPGAPPGATSRPTACGPTCFTSPCSASATAASTRPLPTSAPSGTALFAGRIVSPERVAEMVRPRSDWPEESKRYGLGFHLDATGDAVWLEGYDAGVSLLACTTRRRA